MSFLTPLFLLGALAVTLPVIFHLVRRTTRTRTVFSSLMFLRPAPPRLTRRNRLEHWLLLLLRCAVIGLLALGFARPYLKRAFPESASTSSRRVVVLLDASASMQRGNLWSEARDKAESVLRENATAEEAALFIFDRQLHPLISFEEWKALPAGERAGIVHQRLSDTKAGWAGTHVDQALIRAAEMLTEVAPSQRGARSVVLVTDLQSGSHLQALQGYDWPKGVELVVERMVLRGSSNAGLQLVADSPDAPPSTEPAVRVRVSNEPDSKNEKFQVSWANTTGFVGSNRVDVYVPPGQSRVVSLAATNVSGADRIILRGDDENFDNTIYAVPPEPTRSVIVYVGDDQEANARQPLYFLRRAFQETRGQTVEIRASKASAELKTQDLDLAAMFIVATNLPATQMRALAEEVKKGKTLLLSLTAGADSAALANLFGLQNIRVEEATGDYAMLGEIDFRHPLFAPFADPRFSDFTKIHFWKHRRIDTNALSEARMVARFDNGDPAIVEISLGKGRVMLFTTGWHPDESQLALSSKFVPMLYSMLEFSGARQPAPPQVFIGDAVPLPSVAAKIQWTLTRPDGTKTTLTGAATNAELALLPGIYSLAGEGPPRRFGVNLDPAESRTSPMAVEDLERFGNISVTPLNTPAEKDRKLQLQNAELESRQKLWRWFIVGTLIVLVTETWLAGRTARRLTVSGEAQV
jgi:hypothetical protein